MERERVLETRGWYIALLYPFYRVQQYLVNSINKYHLYTHTSKVQYLEY